MQPLPTLLVLALCSHAVFARSLADRRNSRGVSKEKNKCNTVAEAIRILRDGYAYPLVTKTAIEYMVNDGTIHFDITDDDEVKKIACKVADAESLTEIGEIINYPKFPDTFYQVQIGYQMSKAMMQDRFEVQKDVMNFAIETGFPDLPLSTSEDTLVKMIDALVQKHGVGFLAKLSYMYSPQDMRRFEVHDSRELARALRASNSVDELADLLGFSEDPDLNGGYLDIISTLENPEDQLKMISASQAMFAAMDLLDSVGINDLPTN